MRTMLTLAAALALTAAVAAEAQQPRPAKKATAKAKRVWTNDDFPDRPAPRAAAAEKQEMQPGAGTSAPEKPGLDERDKAAIAEKISELDRTAESTARQMESYRAEMTALSQELKQLEARRVEAASLAEQSALGEEIRAKRRELIRVQDQFGLAENRWRNLRRQKRELVPEDAEESGVPPQPNDAQAGATAVQQQPPER